MFAVISQFSDLNVTCAHHKSQSRWPAAPHPAPPSELSGRCYFIIILIIIYQWINHFYSMLSFLGRYVLLREKYKIDIFEFIKYHIGHWSWWYPYNLSSSCWGWVWGWLYNSNGVQTTQLIQRGRAGAWLPSRAAICPQLSWWYNYSAAVMLLPVTHFSFLNWS